MRYFQCQFCKTLHQLDEANCYIVNGSPVPDNLVNETCGCGGFDNRMRELTLSQYTLESAVVR